MLEITSSIWGMLLGGGTETSFAATGRGQHGVPVGRIPPEMVSPEAEEPTATLCKSCLDKSWPGSLQELVAGPLGLHRYRRVSAEGPRMLHVLGKESKDEG